jgi:hypothetical protein
MTSLALVGAQRPPKRVPGGLLWLTCLQSTLCCPVCPPFQCQLLCQPYLLLLCKLLFLRCPPLCGSRRTLLLSGSHLVLALGLLFVLGHLRLLLLQSHQMLL